MDLLILVARCIYSSDASLEGKPGEVSARPAPGDPAFNPMSEITQVLEAVGRGEGGASEDLLPLVYDQLRRLAAGRMAHEAAGQTL